MRCVLAAIGCVLLLGCLTKPNPEHGANEDATAGQPTSTTTASTTTTPTTTTTATTTAGSASTSGSTAEATSSGSSSTGAIVVPVMFGEPVPLDTLNDPGAADDDPTVRRDGLEMYFASTRGSSEDLYRSVRNSVDDPWGPPQGIPELTTVFVESTPVLSEDGLLITFVQAQDPLAQFDVHYARRSSVDSPWVYQGLIPGMQANGSNTVAAFLLPDELTAYFCSNRGPNGDEDIYRVTRTSTAANFMGAMELSMLSSDARDCVPWVDDNDQLMLFGSGRIEGGVSQDIYMTRRLGADWEAPILLDELEAAAMGDHTTDPWLTDDLSELYFARGPDASSTDLYVVQVLNPEDWLE